MSYAPIVSALSLLCVGCSFANVEPTAVTPITLPAITVPGETGKVTTSVAPVTTQPTKSLSQPAPAIAQASLYDPDGVLASAARFSGVVGTVEGDRALSNFLFDNDGKWVKLDVFISENNEYYGENWLALCANATAEDNCTAVSMNVADNDFGALLLVAVEGGQELSGYWKVQANPGMHQGFLSISLGAIP
ncbi:MAG: hypothetical protein AAFP03_12100 [Cyanobacteria bacterium J06598_3]